MSFLELTAGLNEISKMTSCTHTDVEAYSKKVATGISHRDAMILTSHHDFEERNKEKLVQDLVKQLIEEDLIVFSKEPDLRAPEPYTRYRASLRIFDELGFRRQFRSMDFI